MSRIGKKPVAIPAGVTATVDGQHIKVKGAKGELSFTAPLDVIVTMADGAIKVASLISGWISLQMRLARFDPMNFKVGNLTQCIHLLKLLAGAACMTVLHRVVGTSTALAAATVAISSSETPPGRWEHMQSLQSVGESAQLLGHSQIYGDERVAADIARWIGQRLA